MAFVTGMLASEAFALIRNYVPQYKAAAQGTVTVMAANSIDSGYVFTMLDQLKSIVDNLNTWKAVTGLNTYATAQGYSGTMTTDVTAIVTAATACISWVVTNFPSSAGFLQSHTLNADGTRTPRSFTPAQTAGLQTAVTALIATIS
jgi:hypothetical protein